MSKIQTGKVPIITEIALHRLLRWLSAGSCLAIRISAGIGISSLCVNVHKCIDVKMACNQLFYSFPTGDHEIQKAANDFKQWSTRGIIDGCVACLDALLIQIQTPSSHKKPAK